MKTLIALIFFLLIAAPIIADDTYAVVTIDTRIEQDQEDFLQVLENIKEYGGDAEIIGEMQRPVWTKKVNTNIKVIIIPIRIDNLGVNGWKNKPLSQIETVITKDVKPPSKQWVLVITMEELKADYNKPRTAN